MASGRVILRRVAHVLITSRHGRLPADLTGFVGREREVGELLGLLRSARMVTVTGPGGVGKTRLALRAAARLDGGQSRSCLVELSGLSDPELLPHTVATSLGIDEHDTRDRLDAIIDQLRAEPVLLIMDTCEHLVDACAILAELLLRAAPGLTVLATSRRPLDVPGERAYPVAPMPPDSEAVTLFEQRASTVTAGFAVTDANRDSVLRICRRLDGMPRHQTLRSAIEWSYDLCTPAEQTLWARLSVLAGSFSLASAEGICSGRGLAEADVLPAIIGLVDKSVVLRTDDANGTSYRLLDTLREFGGDKLAADPAEQAATRAALVVWYRRRAREFSEHLLDDQPARYRALRREHANLRVALEYALAADCDAQDVVSMVADLDVYWHISGLLDECCYWLTAALRKLGEGTIERATALIVRAHAESMQGRAAEGRRDAQEAIAIAERAGDRLTAARARSRMCLALTIAGLLDEATALESVAEAGLGGEHDTAGLLVFDGSVSYRLLQSGEFAECARRCDTGLGRIPPGGTEYWASSYLLAIKGLASFLQRSYQAGVDAATESLRRNRELGEQNAGTAYSLEVLAWLDVPWQRHERTAWLMGAADPLWKLAGTRLGGNYVLENFHRDAERAARGALGDEHFDELFLAGSSYHLGDLLDQAITGADTLRPAGSDTGAAEPAHQTLTAREHEVALLIAEGLSNREIAQRLVVSKRTVDAHVEHIFGKLGVNSRTLVAVRLTRS